MANDRYSTRFAYNDYPRFLESFELGVAAGRAAIIRDPAHA